MVSQYHPLMNTPPQISKRSRRPDAAFSLIELLSVMAIIVTLSAVSMPAITSIKGGGSVNKSVADLSSTLELARTYAMANRTYVRVILSEVPAAGDRLLPSIIAQPIYAANGTAAGDMTKSDEWPSLSRPLVLDNLKMYDTMDGAATAVNTSADVTPLGRNVQGAFMAPFTRALPGKGTQTFTGVIQFSPTGEARVSFDEPARFIKISLDQPKDSTNGQKKNPFILRLSGINGSIKILRAGELAL